MSDKKAALAALRAEILELTARYSELEQQDPPAFLPGISRVNYAGRVYDADEMVNLVGAALDFWLTAGPNATRLEKRLADYLGVSHCALVNSGSSANLLAIATLMSPRLGDRRIHRGDEVITVAAGFPTTVAPIVQLGAVPVFVDVRSDTANIDTSQLEPALSSRTRAVMVAHTLGNPFDLDEVLAFCRRHDLWLVEDNCDALGSTYDSAVTGHSARTGSFGHLSTSSFYPPHHMTTGEGGAVYTDSDELATIMESLRDWGRDCYCRSGKDNTCGKRFSQQFGLLPAGYDHKFVYSHFGFNLKMTDLQAAVGLAQLDKLPRFVEARRRNHAALAHLLGDLDGVLRLVSPTPRSTPSWFGFLMVVGDDSPVDRHELTQALERARIQTRSLFAGNLLRHPCFDEMRADASGYRVIGDLPGTDVLADRAVWVGIFPGMSQPELEHIAATVQATLTRRPQLATSARR